MRLARNLLITTALSFASQVNAEGKSLDINAELFDFSVVTGVMSVQDFPAEILVGASLTFKASEDFFLQYNYLQVDLAESSFESNEAGIPFAIGNDRSFQHYDLLIGYTLFQGEFFASDPNRPAHLSSLYLVAGVGDSRLGDEENFTYTVGLGYQVEFYRRYILRMDYRDHIYSTTILEGGEEGTAHSTQMSLGIGYLF